MEAALVDTGRGQLGNLGSLSGIWTTGGKAMLDCTEETDVVASEGERDKVIATHGRVPLLGMRVSEGSSVVVEELIRDCAGARHEVGRSILKVPTLGF
jgi:hypothetical protein